jgi:hypothetical protein
MFGGIMAKNWFLGPVFGYFFFQEPSNLTFRVIMHFVVFYKNYQDQL